MFAIQKLKSTLTNSWVIGVLLLVVFLIGNGYTYGWDDQHLEIPLLKKLIDPELYPGDYYVDGLVKHFPSLFYITLAKVININQIPAVYFTFYLISRYFLFFFMYKIWRVITRDKLLAFLCVLSVLLVGRVDEFLYRTFSHQEFALSVVFAGIYFFYKNRYLLAAACLGLAANIHAVYSLIPFIYLFIFLLVSYRRVGFKSILTATLIFAFFSAPTVFIMFKKFLIAHNNPQDLNEWKQLYLLACPQNFSFQGTPLRDVFANFTSFINAGEKYLFLTALSILNFFFNPIFRKDRHSLISVLVGFTLLIISFFFSEIWPKKFAIDLNLIRNTQFMLFLLMGHTTILFYQKIRQKKILPGLILALIFPLIRFGGTCALTTILYTIFTLWLLNIHDNSSSSRLKLCCIFLGSICSLGFAWILGHIFINQTFNQQALLCLYIILGYIIIVYMLRFLCKKNFVHSLRTYILLFAMIIFLIHAGTYHHYRLQIEKTGQGFWQLQRNWIDMQTYVQKNTMKSARFLVPHDMEMGGFRIGSERTIVMSYRDCGIVGFDYPAALEWQRRLSDIESFQVLIRKPVIPAIIKAVSKYHVDYIVFMNYVAPDANQLFEPVYRNETFSLFKINRLQKD